MIKSKKILSVCEGYVASKKLDKERSLEVYVNPTSSELKNITDKNYNIFGVRQIRFVVDNQNKRVYVADAFLSLHYDIFKLIGLKLTDTSPYYFIGIANIKNGKAFMLEDTTWFVRWFRESFFSRNYPNKYSRNLENLLSSDLRWLDQYIVCSPIIEKLKAEFKRLANINR